MKNIINISVIIINWKSVLYLQKCLNSLYSKTKGVSLEVIVVDNASNDNCEKMLLSEFKAVKFIQSSSNLGFSRGNNLGFTNSIGDVLLFLNPDTEIHGNAITLMYETLLSNQEYGAAGAKLLNTDLTFQESCILTFPTIINQVLDFGFLKANAPTLLRKEVEAVSGACLMVKRDVFEFVGLLSTDYFMYSEDVDLCFKIRKNGFKVIYVGEAEVVHHGGVSSKQSITSHFNSIMMKESTMIFMKKNYSVRYAKYFKVTMFAFSILRVALLIIALPITGKRVLGKWYRILRWTLGLEKPVK